MCFGVARAIIGGGIFYNLLKDNLWPPMQGKEHSEYQQFVDTIIQTNGFTRRVFVRQVDKFLGNSGKGSSTFGLGNFLTGKAQIILFKNSSLTQPQLKFACCHELGHLHENHNLILTAIAAANVALFMIPVIPMRIFFTALTISSIASIFLYRCLDKSADDFAFSNCSPEISNQAFQGYDPNKNFIVKYICRGNPEKRKKAARNQLD